MKLVSPIGVRISVADHRGEKLLKQGYRRADAPASAPAPVPEQPRRTRRKKTEESA